MVRKFLDEVQAQLTDRQVTLEVSPAAVDWLAKRGFDPKYGARPMGRLIHEKIKQPLANEMLFGTLTKGGRAVVDLSGEDLTLHYHPVESAL